MPDRPLDEILRAAERAGVAHRFDGSEHVLFATRRQLIDFVDQLTRIPPPAVQLPSIQTRDAAVPASIPERKSP